MHRLNLFRPQAAAAAKTVAAVMMLFAFQTAYAGCEATMSNINFGNIDPLNPLTLTVQGQLTVTCRRDITSGLDYYLSREYINVCVAADGGRADGWNQRNFNPNRGLCPNGSCANSATPLYYNLYTNPGYSTIWGTPNDRATVMLQTTFTFPAWSNTPLTQTLPVYAKLDGLPANLGPGTYSIDYSGNTTALAYNSSTTSMPPSCGGLRRINFPFTVTANVVKNCTIGTPDNIDFGTVAPTDANLQGQTSFNVACTNGTPYNIGMKPSGNSTTGAGTMRPTASGNTDSVPYQLRSSAGANGRIWGNTATASGAGNGVGGTGTGTAQNYTVYATVPSADYHHGEYRDTVTVTVNY